VVLWGTGEVLVTLPLSVALLLMGLLVMVMAWPSWVGVKVLRGMTHIMGRQ